MFLILGIQVLVKAPIMAFMAIMKITGKEWTFSLITIIGVLIILTLSVVLILVAIPKFKKVQKLTDDINKITRENLTGIRVVRAYNAENYQINKFEKTNYDLTMTHLFTQRLMALISPVMSSVMSGLSLAIYWTGAYIINRSLIMDKINIFSDMVVFSSYAVQVIISFMLLAAIFIIYPRASVSISRINEVLSTNSKIKDGKTSKDNGSKGEVEFVNVSFKYQKAEEYVLKDISFKVNKGEVIGVIGSTGSGKSTLVNLIPRFYDVTEGQILVDGVNIKDMKLEYLYDKLGYISQKAILFKGTVKDNINLGKINGKKVNDELIEESLDIAQASEFVNKMDKGIKSSISQGGTNVYGGQKQRLSIARAIARNPEIYIFDDSFSALDYKTDYNLRKRLNKYTKNSTKFIVSSRIGTIKDADKILVLDNGILVGIGSHKELLNTCKVYREIAESQLSKEELENA
jgi:ATP-binding cassette subfamily B protein